MEATCSLQAATLDYSRSYCCIELRLQALRVTRFVEAYDEQEKESWRGASIEGKSSKDHIQHNHCRSDDVIFATISS